MALSGFCFRELPSALRSSPTAYASWWFSNPSCFVFWGLARQVCHSSPRRIDPAWGRSRYSCASFPWNSCSYPFFTVSLFWTSSMRPSCPTSGAFAASSATILDSVRPPRFAAGTGCSWHSTSQSTSSGRSWLRPRSSWPCSSYRDLFQTVPSQCRRLPAPRVWRPFRRTLCPCHWSHLRRHRRTGRRTSLTSIAWPNWTYYQKSLCYYAALWHIGWSWS